MKIYVFFDVSYYFILYQSQDRVVIVFHK